MRYVHFHFGMPCKLPSANLIEFIKDAWGNFVDTCKNIFRISKSMVREEKSS